MKAIHPELKATTFACQNCGTEHPINSTRGGTMLLDACGVCHLGDGPRRHHSTQIDKFNRRRARRKR